MPSTKAKPTPPMSPRQNKRERNESPDKKSKKRDQSPSKISDKKGKNADHKEKRIKSPQSSTSAHDKKRLTSPAKQDKDKQVKKEAPSAKAIKLDITKPIKVLKQGSKKEKEQEKRVPIKFTDIGIKSLKRPHSSCSQKLLNPHKEIKFIPNRSKSQKAICVNTVNHWYSPLDNDDISDSQVKDPKSDLTDADPKRSALKRLLRRQVWYVSKGVIKRNEDWSKLMAENRIDVDKINIDALDLTLIDIDALGIENKLLKRTITWFLK